MAAKTFKEYIQKSGYNEHEKTIMEMAWDEAMNTKEENFTSTNNGIKQESKAQICPKCGAKMHHIMKNHWHCNCGRNVRTGQTS